MTTTTPTIGLNTLSQKVANLESALNIPSETVGFADSAIKAVIEAKEAKLKADLSKIEQDYLSCLQKNNIDVSTPEAVLLNATKIIRCTVKYIEANGLTIAKTIGTDLTSGFKLSTCVNLCEAVLKGALPNSHLVAYINDFVSLLFPNTQTNTSTNDDDTASVSTVKTSKTIKRIGRYVLRKSGIDVNKRKKLKKA